MAKAGKAASKRSKTSVKVRDLKPRKNAKGGAAQGKHFPEVIITTRKS